MSSHLQTAAVKPVWLIERALVAGSVGVPELKRGIRNPHCPIRLRAALSWPLNLLALARRPVSLTDLAAAYARGILRLKPFAYANEAIAYLAAKTFLSLNGIKITTKPRESFLAFSAFASGRMPLRVFSKWLLLNHLANLRASGLLSNTAPAGLRKLIITHTVRVRFVTKAATADAAATPSNAQPAPDHT